MHFLDFVHSHQRSYSQSPVCSWCFGVSSARESLSEPSLLVFRTVRVKANRPDLARSESPVAQVFSGTNLFVPFFWVAAPLKMVFPSIAGEWLLVSLNAAVRSACRRARGRAQPFLPFVLLPGRKTLLPCGTRASLSR